MMVVRLQGDETDRAAVRQLRKAVTRAEPITVRLVNYKKSGEPWWNLLTLSPVKNAAGKVRASTVCRFQSNKA